MLGTPIVSCWSHQVVCMVSPFSFSILKLLYTPLSQTTSSTIPVLDRIIPRTFLSDWRPAFTVRFVAVIAQPLTCCFGEIKASNMLTRTHLWSNYILFKSILCSMNHYLQNFYSVTSELYFSGSSHRCTIS